MTVPDHVTSTFRPVADQPFAGGSDRSGPRLVAPGSVTNHEFGLFEISISGGAMGPGAHYHTTFTESFYVLEGRVQLRLGDQIETVKVV